MKTCGKREVQAPVVITDRDQDHTWPSRKRKSSTRDLLVISAVQITGKRDRCKREQI
jgi:hypothetical protein